MLPIADRMRVWEEKSIGSDGSHTYTYNGELVWWSKIHFNHQASPEHQEKIYSDFVEKFYFDIYGEPKRRLAKLQYQMLALQLDYRQIKTEIDAIIDLMGG